MVLQQRECWISAISKKNTKVLTLWLYQNTNPATLLTHICRPYTFYMTWVFGASWVPMSQIAYMSPWFFLTQHILSVHLKPFLPLWQCSSVFGDYSLLLDTQCSNLYTCTRDNCAVSFAHVPNCIPNGSEQFQMEMTSIWTLSVWEELASHKRPSTYCPSSQGWASVSCPSLCMLHVCVC